MVTRSIILVITLILICIHIANFGIFSHEDEKSEKKEARLESMLTDSYLLSLTPTNDNLEVGFTYHVL